MGDARVWMAQNSAAGQAPIPPARKDDSEDVAWALSTAEAMYARGDHGDALKWLRRAAESASEAQADERALELAKAAADLATLAGPTPSVAPPPPPARASQAPPPPRSVRPQPAGLANAYSAPPPAAADASPVRPSPPLPPAATPLAVTQRAGGPLSPRPLVREGLDAAPAPHRVSEPRRAARRSRPEIDLARRPDEPTQTMHDPPLPLSQPRRRGRASRPAVEELTPLANPTLPGPPPRAPAPDLPQVVGTDDMDAWPTQSRHGPDDFGDDSPDEKTRIGVPAYEASARMATDVQSTPSLPMSPDETPLRAAQAIRVVVWRSSDGVHMAPHGTAVAAITVDAILVALDPSADLAAWLSGK